MENKKINVSFYLVAIFFLVLIIILINGFKAQRANDYKRYIADITNMVNRDNYKIRVLAKENADLKNTLAETRNSLDVLSKKLAQPVPVEAPATAAK